MTFNDVLVDIEKMIGLELESINSGANIRIEEVDWETERILLYAYSTERKGARPFSEIQKIWNYLNSQYAVHVDSALGGSGSSRNQPETILANLPYIEWFKYKGRKHIVLVEKPSHEYGTLRAVDSVIASELKERLEKNEFSKGADPTQVVVVSGDLTTHTKSFEKIAGIPPTPLEKGVYEFVTSGCRVIVAAESAVEGKLLPGTYLVLKKDPAGFSGRRVVVAGKSYIMHGADGLNALFLLD